MLSMFHLCQLYCVSNSLTPFFYLCHTAHQDPMNMLRQKRKRKQMAKTEDVRDGSDEHCCMSVKIKPNCAHDIIAFGPFETVIVG